MGLLIVAATGLAFWFAAIQIKRHCVPEPPYWLVALYASLVVIIGGYVVFNYVFYAVDRRVGMAVTFGVGYGGAMIRLCGSLLFFIPAIYSSAFMVAEAVADFFTSFNQKSTVFAPSPTGYGRAWKFAREGSVVAAVREFRKYFEEEPTIPAPLFGAAQLLQDKGQYNEAAAIYEEIRTKFFRITHVWVEATFRLSELRHQQMNDLPAAIILWRELTRRVSKDSKTGQMAAHRLFEHSKDKAGDE